MYDDGNKFRGLVIHEAVVNYVITVLIPSW
jgi:hypothetical protein